MRLTGCLRARARSTLHVCVRVCLCACVRARARSTVTCVCVLVRVCMCAYICARVPRVQLLSRPSGDSSRSPRPSPLPTRARAPLAQHFLTSLPQGAHVALCHALGLLRTQECAESGLQGCLLEWLPLCMVSTCACTDTGVHGSRSRRG